MELVEMTKGAYEPPFSREELAEMDAAFERYSRLHSLYEQLIDTEECPRRQGVLRGLLEDLREDNK